ncbi:undecaprenyl-phosphate glucose phosphotransferase [Fulvimarina sp. 2208YS6-2-32]|uniref:Undecaprenyl-phosphate glucose phosphotransferase n=1 Tax=Fulvimarina uroteuthidis TaxID=3098149 RepID=A0ABU5HX25_9HYPH|nr:undecaprenyl-phosphate glucose phosphotransferase [Fulvimarina sp. 2208YS6-2-32]MDY8107686.1 undecaprenyl-phosphate glucose phosphotransferase [Fulvimarina sp. 2208YS6-2-32]
MDHIDQYSDLQSLKAHTPGPAVTPDQASHAELNSLAARIAQHYRTDFITPHLLTGYLRLVEFTVLALLGSVFLVFYVELSTRLLWSYVTVILLGSALGVIAINLAGAYRLTFLRRSVLAHWRVGAAWMAVVFGMTAALFFLYDDNDHSRVFLAGWFLSGFAALSVIRLVLCSFIRKWARDGRMERRAVIVGGGKNAEDLIRGLEAQSDSDIRICGIFDDRNDRRSPPVVAGYPKLGTIPELVAFSRMTRIDMLIVTLPLSAEQRLLTLLKKLWVLPVDIRLSAHATELHFRPRSYSFIGEIPMIDVLDRPLADWDWIAKRVFDVVVAALAILVLSPVLLITALAVKLDTPGPVIFRQKRHGFNNQTIEVFKFRSLRHEFSDPEARRVVTRNDRRVTRVGAFIRKTSIDELPQLFNVLRGELSLVGPRPHALHAQSSQNETFTLIVDGYFGRHKVKPGITGWAQIKGWRGEIDQPDKLKRRFEHDLYYIENWSLRLDLYILLMTPISMLRKTDGAY